MREEKLIVSIPPHIQSAETIPKIMFITAAALIPTAASGIYFFGINAVKVIVIAILSAIVFEAGLQRLMKREITLKDGSALLTGLLFGLILPPTAPWWLIAAGVFFGMLIGKHVYGGLGNNPFNSVAVGWAALQLSYPSYLDISESILGKVKIEGISALVEDYVYFSEQYGVESLEGIGAKLKLLFKLILAWKPMPGEALVDCIGQISPLAIIIGGLFLLWKGYISWHIPVSLLASIILCSILGQISALAVIIGTLAVIIGLLLLWRWKGHISFLASLILFFVVILFSIIIFKGGEYLYPYVLVQLLSGGTLLAAFFIATDPVTSPTTGQSRIILGVLLGLIVIIGRIWGSWIDPIWFCVLVMNAFTPLIERLTKPKPFGRLKESA